VRLIPGIQDARSGILTHPCNAHLMDDEAQRLVNQKNSANVLRPDHLKDFRRCFDHVLAHRISDPAMSPDGQVIIFVHDAA
jgi:hypothetical protein